MIIKITKKKRYFSTRGNEDESRHGITVTRRANTKNFFLAAQQPRGNGILVAFKRAILSTDQELPDRKGFEFLKFDFD